MSVNNKEVHKIFQSLGLNVERIEKIDTLANYLTKVQTNKGNYFLKVYKNAEESRTGYKLSNLYPLLLNYNIPVPQILKYDDSLNLIMHPYLIMSEVEGDMLYNSINTMNKETKYKIFNNLGKILARIHSINFDKFGETFDGKKVQGFSEIGFKGPFDKWKNMHKEIIKYRLSLFKDSSFEEFIKPTTKWFEKNEHLIDYKITPRLLHIDLNQKNIFIKNNEISGIVDFDGAFVGHNEEELMRLENANFGKDTKLRSSFYDGYNNIINLDEGYEERRTFYYLSRLLVHIDCLISFGSNYVNNPGKEEKLMKDELNNILK